MLACIGRLWRSVRFSHGLGQRGSFPTLRQIRSLLTDSLMCVEGERHWDKWSSSFKGPVTLLLVGFQGSFPFCFSVFLTRRCEWNKRDGHLYNWLQILFISFFHCSCNGSEWVCVISLHHVFIVSFAALLDNMRGCYIIIIIIII